MDLGELAAMILVRTEIGRAEGAGAMRDAADAFRDALATLSRRLKEGAFVMGAVNAELHAEDIMSPEPVCVGPATRIRELGRTLESNGISGAPVVDQQGQVIGVVSRSDLLRACIEGTADIPPAYLYETLREQSDEDTELSPESTVCVQEIMTEDPVTVGLDTPVSRVAKLMHQGRIHRVIVVDEERFPLGIITSLDVLGAIFE